MLENDTKDKIINFLKEVTTKTIVSKNPLTFKTNFKTIIPMLPF
jgi:hypothetical protein